MDLLELLDVEEEWLPEGTEAAVEYCQERWVSVGRPADRVWLITFLNNALKYCVNADLRYPGIFLKRLKQLQRGEWIPRFKDIASKTQLKPETSTSSESSRVICGPNALGPGKRTRG